jgi:hypothetical protein
MNDMNSFLDNLSILVSVHQKEELFHLCVTKGLLNNTLYTSTLQQGDEHCHGP